MYFSLIRLRPVNTDSSTYNPIFKQLVIYIDDLSSKYRSSSRIRSPFLLALLLVIGYSSRLLFYEKNIDFSQV